MDHAAKQLAYFFNKRVQKRYVVADNYDKDIFSIVLINGFIRQHGSGFRITVERACGTMEGML